MFLSDGRALTVRPFVCPDCGALLAKSDGEMVQTYCRRCHQVKLAYAELRELLQSATSVSSSGRRG